MKEKMHKLLKDAMGQNHADVDVITKKLKLPWLKLKINFPSIEETYFKKLQTEQDWRKKWQFQSYEQNSYQVKGWHGDFLFGPKPFDKFLEEFKTEISKYGKIDEDCICRTFRNKFKFDWHVDENDFIRQWINQLIPDEDLNIVNTYFLPPGGYVFPHRDYSHDDLSLAKIYIAARWKEGNEFGVYGCGNIPIKETDVFLINNYTLPHWVYNGSNDTRLVIDIGANLNSPKIKKIIEDSFQNFFCK